MVIGQNFLYREVELYLCRGKVLAHNQIH